MWNRRRPELYQRPKGYVWGEIKKVVKEIPMLVLWLAGWVALSFAIDFLSKSCK